MPEQREIHRYLTAILIFLYISLLPDKQCCQAKPENNVRFTANDHLIIVAENDKKMFTILTSSDTIHWVKCSIKYSALTFVETVTAENRQPLTHDARSIGFVHNVAVGVKHNASHPAFAVVGRNSNGNTIIWTIDIGPMTYDDDRCVQKNDGWILRAVLYQGNYTEEVLLAMNPSGNKIYTIPTRSFCIVYRLDINSKTFSTFDIDHYYTHSGIHCNSFRPKVIAITEDEHVFLVVTWNKYSYLLVYSFINKRLLLEKQLSTIPLKIESDPMSFSVDDEAKLAVIGIPQLDQVLIVSMRILEQQVFIRVHKSSKNGVGFGQSVALLNEGAYAVLAHSLPTLPWSSSQIQVYSLRDTEQDPIPMFIIPNNQMPINSASPYRIVRIVSWYSGFGIILDSDIVRFIPTSPPGHCSTNAIQVNDLTTVVSVFTSTACILGTSRNTTSLGPCLICPPGLKNNGSRIQCEQCSVDEPFCIRSATPNAIDAAVMSSYDQVVSYPESSESTQFSDILLRNIWKFTTNSTRCLFISPIFWASLTIGLEFIIFLIVRILFYFPRYKLHRVRLKKIFTRLDLIGGGEFWLGGLGTLPIIVLIIFSCKFSISFARLYPMESTSSDSQKAVSCDSALLNAKFTSSLQLLSTLKHEEEMPIFSMLNEQDITLTVHFVSTGFSCTSVIIQQNLDRGQRKVLKNFHCSSNSDSGGGILSVSMLLPQHLITIQFNLTGPYFVGGLRICLSGSSIMKNDGKYAVQQLDFCQFLFPSNQTLSIDSMINIEMTKIINRTVAMGIHDENLFSGLWLPKIKTRANTLWDSHLYSNDDEYLRYLNLQMTLVIDITDSIFYMKTIQEPIARQYEIFFNTFLFSMLCLDIFGLLFLIIKMLIRPLVQLVQKWFICPKNQVSQLVRLVFRHRFGKQDQLRVDDATNASHNEKIGVVIQGHSFHEFRGSIVEQNSNKNSDNFLRTRRRSSEY